MERYGCSGWSYDDWKGAFYPDDLARTRWLEHYSSVFDTVEVNATFYRLQSESTFRKWADATPDEFAFAVKASRYLTHIRRLRDTGRGLKRFWEPLKPLRETGKLGPVLWQLPENFHVDLDALRGLLPALPEATHCFEFRHESWFGDEVFDLLRDAGHTVVWPDDARRDLPEFTPLPGPLFIRFHYGSRGRSGNYSDAELATWRRRIAAWKSRHDVYAYFNNDWQAFAPANAIKLRDGLDGSA